MRVKEFFTRTEEEESEEIVLSGLREWLQYRSRELIINAKLQEEAQKYAAFLKDKRWFLECQLDKWQEKAREYAQVEEVTPLFRETRRVLELLTFPDPVSLEKVLEQNVQLEQKIHVLSQKVEASSLVHDFDFLFSDGASQEDLNPLLKELLDMDAQRKAFKQKVIQSGYINLVTVASKVAVLEQSLEQIHHWERELDSKKNRLQATDEKKLEKEKDLFQLRNQAKSLDLENFKKKQNDLLQKIDENETEIVSFFSKIKPLLSHYKEIEAGNALAAAYLADPLSAFLQDERLSIKHVLDHLKALLKSGKLPLNQGAFITSLTLLEQVHGPALEQLRLQHNQLQQELKQTREHLQHDDVGMKIDDAAYRLDHFTKQVERLDQQVSVWEEKVETLREAVLREQQLMQNLIRTGLGRNVVIKV